MRKVLYTTAVLVSFIDFIVIIGGLFITTWKGNQSKTTPSNRETEKNPSSLFTPTLDRVEVLNNLNHPWDIGFIDGNNFIITERSGEISHISDETKRILIVPSDILALGEGGMTGLAIDPNFNDNRYIYTCFNTQHLDIRVVRWRVSNDFLNLEDRRDIIVGIPSNPSGRHSGCQLEFDPDGNLWIGTGDAAIGTTAQDPMSLGGKILRTDREGNGVIGNLGNGFDPRIYSYGHRNTQGISFLKTSPIHNIIGLTTEHGPKIDDEINILEKGNFGWDPIPGYNESVPMTDLNKYPESIQSVWSSGNPTIAISGITQVVGQQWGVWDGSIAISALAGNQVKILKFNESKLQELATVLTDIGRIRTIQQGSDGNLYVLTDNGGNSDKIIMLVPREQQIQ